MDHILGQDNARQTLESALAHGRLHHALIFHGPAGVGKFTTAIAFARLLLCHSRETDLMGRMAACSSCESCRLLHDDAGDDDAGAHPDVHVIRKELAGFSSNAQLRNRKQLTIPLDLLRERMLGGRTGDDRTHEAIAYRTAAMRHGKVFIIDEAELLAQEGQNALLKTLEEPSPDTYVVLITSKEHHLLPTIRSRCHRVAFAPLSDDVVETWLNEQRSDLTPAARRWVVAFAEGSLGRAALAADYDLMAWGKQIDPALKQLERGQYPTMLGETMSELIKAFAESWVKTHKNASKEAANKRAAALMWSLIAQHARRRLRDTAESIDPADPVAGDRAVQPWVGMIDALDESERHLASNVNLTLTVEHLVSRMTRACAG